MILWYLGQKPEKREAQFAKFSIITVGSSVRFAKCVQSLIGCGLPSARSRCISIMARIRNLERGIFGFCLVPPWLSARRARCGRSTRRAARPIKFRCVVYNQKCRSFAQGRYFCNISSRMVCAGPLRREKPTCRQSARTCTRRENQRWPFGSSSRNCIRRRLRSVSRIRDLFECCKRCLRQKPGSRYPRSTFNRLEPLVKNPRCRWRK